MPLSRVQTVLWCVERPCTSPTSRSVPYRDHPTESSKMTATVMVFKMEMTCDGCANAARKVLGKLEEVTKVDTDLQAQTVTVNTTLSWEEILEALRKTGKTVTFVSKT